MTGYAPGPGPLTPRLRQVLELYAAGKPRAAIAAELFIAESTVRHLREQALERLGVHSLPAAIDRMRAGAP